jgi:energy-coupling factor transport system ATP-binding protein
MNEGKCVLTGTPIEVFKQSDMLVNIGLGVPQVTTLIKRLKQSGMDIRDDILTIEEAKKELLSILRRRSS